MQNRCHILTFIVIFILMSFCTRPPFNLWLQIHLCCPRHLCYPLLILPSINAPISAVIEVVLVEIGVPTATTTTTNTCLIFMVFIPLLPQTGSRATDSKLDGSLVLGSGLLTALYSRTSSVSCASPSATHPLSALSFTAVANNPLLILLLALFLPLLGFQTLVRTNILRLILQL